MNLNNTKCKSRYSCHNCDKSYTRKSSLEKHSLLCEFLLITKREKQVFLEEKDELPSYQQLVEIVLDLSKKYNYLSNKLNEMQIYQKKKMRVLDWLNKEENKINIMDFADWQAKLFILPSHINSLLENSLMDTIKKIFECNHIFQNNVLIPIKCFQQKSNIIYILQDQNWIHLELPVFNKLLFSIQKKMLEQLTLWRNNNQLNSDEQSITYNNALFKLLSLEQHSCKIKNLLYNLLKKDLKSLIEYEFEF